MSNFIKHSAILLSGMIAFQSLSFESFSEVSSQAVFAQSVRKARKPLGKKGNCQRDQTHGDLIAIVPETGEDRTVSQTPSFFFYVPDVPQAGLQVTFRVKANNRNVFPPMVVALAGTPGIVKVQVPQSLKQDQTYQWSLEISCGAEKTTEVQGAFVSKPVSDELKAQIAQASFAQQKAVLYQKAGLMLDAVAVLAEAPRSTDWEMLLQTLNLPELKQKPIVQCCVPK